MKWLYKRHWHSKRYAVTALLLMAVVLLVGGCLFVKSGTAALTRFNHQQHAENVEECENCHNTAEAGVSSRADHKNCSVCHDIDMDQPGEDCLYCHVLPKEQGVQMGIEQLLPLLKDYAAKHEKKSCRQKKTIWEHAFHEGKVTCAECHGEVVAGARKAPPRTMEQCMKCHEQRDAARECATCHKKIRRNVAPKNHRQGWLLQHGPVSRIENERSCSFCHQTTTFCDDCHKTERPENHTAMFRKRGHGFFAEGDRRNCAVCHQPDFCDACHQQNEPTSHTGAFKRFGHCRSCHEQSTQRGTKCQVCHKRNLTEHAAGKPRNGTWLHDLPQGFGLPLGVDCVKCHDFSQ